MKEDKIETQIIGNTGMYYACYQLSNLGWNVMPTARNARGFDIVAYAPDGDGYLGIQVKTLSAKKPVPVGASRDKVMGNFWVIVVLATPDHPDVYVLTGNEVKDLARRYEKDGKESYWLQPKDYTDPAFKNQWARIFF